MNGTLVVMKLFKEFVDSFFLLLRAVLTVIGVINIAVGIYALFTDGVIVGLFIIPFGIFLIRWMRHISKKEDKP